MKILVLNCGSSSIKYKLFDMTSGEVMAQGGIEKIGLPGAFLKLTDKEGKKVVIEREIPGPSTRYRVYLERIDRRYLWLYQGL